MPKLILSLLVSFSFLFSTQATENIERYASVAVNQNKEIAYTEKHEVTYKNLKVQKAKTEYLNPTGHLIAEMNSDFSKKNTIPDYEYRDFRFGTSHGINYSDSKITLWNKRKDGTLEKKDFNPSDFPSESLLLGCQGLHYCLVENLRQVKEKKKIPVVYFIPGKLDYYKFDLYFESEDEQYIYLKLSIHNFFLRLFTSSLNLKYKKNDKRIVQFVGLSNIPDDKDHIQNVTIDFKYE